MPLNGITLSVPPTATASGLSEISALLAWPVSNLDLTDDVDEFAAKHVPATFCVLGHAAAGDKPMIKNIKAAGHEVENQSWSHPILTEVSAERVRSEISREGRD